MNPYEAPQSVERQAVTAETHPAKLRSDSQPFSVKILIAIQIAAGLLTILVDNLHSLMGGWSEPLITAAMICVSLYLILTLAMIVLMIVLRSSNLLGIQLIVFMSLFLLFGFLAGYQGRL